MLPTKDEAERLLSWASEQNPGIWVDHCKTVARAAETIASKCGLDVNRAYISGLLHDIGRYEGVRKLHHVYAGYELLKGKGYNEISEICLSHSFPVTYLEDTFMRKKASKLLSVLLTAVLVFSAVPAAYAAEEAPVAETEVGPGLEDNPGVTSGSALSAAEIMPLGNVDEYTALRADCSVTGSGDVVLTGDIIGDAQLNIKRDLTLDLAGHSLTIIGSFDNCIKIASGVTLTIKDNRAFGKRYYRN